MIIQSPLKEYQQYIKPVSHKDIYEYHKKGFQLELENMGPRKAPVYLKEGPVKQRQCRDLLCLIILFFVITYQIFVLTQIGFSNTKTFLKLSKPYDYDHKQCGVGSRKGFDYIYYVTPFEGYLDRTVCVKECPNNVGIDKTPYLLCHPNSGVPKCTQQITGNYENEVMVYNSYKYSQRICLPQKASYQKAVITELNFDNIQESFYNVQQTLPVIIAAPFICMGIGFIVFGIMHYFPRATTWIYLFTVMFCSGIIGEIFFYRALYGFNGNLVKIQKPDESNHETFMSLKFSNTIILHITIQCALFVITSRFFIAIGDFITQQSACLWYYQKDNAVEYDSVIWESIKITFGNHLGSLFFYSLVSILIFPYNFFMKFIYKCIVPYTFNEKNQYQYLCSTCCVYSCCCYTNLTQFLHDEVLAWVAMTGSGYYKSSKEVYYLTKRNKHRLEKAENVNTMFRVLGKLFLCLLSSFICIAIILYTQSFRNKITLILVPVVLILSLTYTTGHFFFGIYSKSADAILIASFIDEEVEMEHFGREFVYNCPNSIRPYISQLHQAQ